MLSYPSAKVNFPMFWCVLIFGRCKIHFVTLTRNRCGGMYSLVMRTSTFMPLRWNVVNLLGFITWIGNTSLSTSCVWLCALYSKSHSRCSAHASLRLPAVSLFAFPRMSDQLRTNKKVDPTPQLSEELFAHSVKFIPPSGYFNSQGRDKDFLGQ